MGSHFRQFSSLFIHTDAADSWEEVILLHNVQSLRWVVLDHSESAVIKDFSQLGCRPHRPRLGSIRSFSERPSSEVLETWAEFAKELALWATCSSGLPSQLQSSTTPEISQIATAPNHNRDLNHTSSEELQSSETSVQSHLTPGRGRGRSASQTRALSEPSNPQSGSRGTRSEQRYMNVFGYGFQHFTRQAIREFVQGNAEIVEPDYLGIHEADLLLRMLNTQRARELLPRQFVWQSPDIQFLESAVLVFEMKSSLRGASVAARQLRSRFAGLAVERETPIHLVLVIHCAEGEITDGFPALESAVQGEPDILLVFTQFRFELALQSDNFQAGFSMPFQVRFQATPDEATFLGSAEHLQEQATLEEHASSQASHAIAELPNSITNSTSTMTSVLQQHASDTGTHGQILQLQSFLGHWRTSNGTFAIVTQRTGHDDSLNVKFLWGNTAPSDLHATVAHARTFRLRPSDTMGNFTCGAFSLNAAESSADQRIWVDSRNPNQTVIWNSVLQLSSFLGTWSVSNGQVAVVSQRAGHDDSLAVKFLWNGIDPRSQHAASIRPRFVLRPGSRIGAFTCGAFDLQIDDSCLPRRVWIDRRDPDLSLTWERFSASQ